MTSAHPLIPTKATERSETTRQICQLEAGGPWQISRHADVHQVLKDNETYSSEVSIRPPEERGQPTMLFSDPPLHHRLRKLVSSAFKPSHIERQADRITARAELLIKDLPTGRSRRPGHHLGSTLARDGDRRNAGR